jgi:hypothetical protein
MRVRTVWGPHGPLRGCSLREQTPLLVTNETQTLILLAKVQALAKRTTDRTDIPDRNQNPCARFLKIGNLEKRQAHNGFRTDQDYHLNDCFISLRLGLPPLMI